MEKYNEIINDDVAFENTLIRAMHRVGRERDRERIKAIRNMSSEEFRKVIGASGMTIPLRRHVLRYAAAAWATANDTPRIALAPRFFLVGVPSRAIIFMSI